MDGKKLVVMMIVTFRMAVMGDCNNDDNVDDHEIWMIKKVVI